MVGLGLFLVGVLLVLWARWTLGAMYGVSTSCAVQLKERHRLIQHGPYALVRHPMYLGYWLLLAGVALIYRTWSPLLFLAMFVPAFYRRAQREEQALEAMFGAEWQAYAARVPMFVPRWSFQHITRGKRRE
ncbi:MAG: methyltransferase family protein [Anaerolineae bacterium]